MSDFYFNPNPDELYHYGVLGMKWGQRKSEYSNSYSNVRNAKAAYKQANKYYNKSFKKASNYSQLHPISRHVSEKVKARDKKKWKTASSAAAKANTARTAYKQAKKQNKQEIVDNYKSIKKNSSFGEKLMYNDATYKKAAKYVTNYKNMSVSDAKKKAKGDAMRNTAAILAACGTMTVASKYTPYNVTDAAGKVLKRGLMRK